MQIEWPQSISNNIRQELEKLLSNYSLNQKVNIGIGSQPLISINNNFINITLSELALRDEVIALPQCYSLLMMKQDILKIPPINQDIQMKSYWTFIDPLDRYLAVSSGIHRPESYPTIMFLDLIKSLKQKINGLKVLEIGTGTGVLAIQLARFGASVVALDILPDAIENAKLNLALETTKVQQLIKPGISDVYKNLSEITSSPSPKFDIVIFSAPLLKGDPKPDSTLSYSSYAGTNFSVLKEAISNLPNVLNENGNAYFLVAKYIEKTNVIWTQDHLHDFLPPGWSYSIASPWFDIDKSLDHGVAILRIYKKQ